MVKKYKKSSKKKKKYNKSSMKDILAAGGEISSSIGVVMAWIVGVISILMGIFMIVIGIDPNLLFPNSGTCTDTSTTGNNPSKTDHTCMIIQDKEVCQSNQSCNWNKSKIHGGFQVAYILGGLGLIAFSVGIIIFSYWWNRKVHENSNMAAFAGGMTAVNVLSSGMNRGYGTNRGYGMNRGYY